MNQTKPYQSKHHTQRYNKINLATAPHLVDLPPDQVLVLEQPYDEFIGITFTYGASKPGATVTHPQIARSRAENMEYKHSYRDWRRRDVVKHHLVFARQDVYLIIPDKPIWTYPLIEINQVECHLDVSGSSPAKDDHRTRNYIDNNPHVIWDSPCANAFKQLAELALRGTPREPYRFRDEIEAEFWAQVTDKMVTTDASGSWRVGVPEGMVLVGACIGGTRAPNYSGPTHHYLLPKAEYHQRAMVIDTTKYQPITPEPFAYKPNYAKAA